MFPFMPGLPASHPDPSYHCTLLTIFCSPYYPQQKTITGILSLILSNIDEAPWGGIFPIGLAAVFFTGITTQQGVHKNITNHTAFPLPEATAVIC